MAKKSPKRTWSLPVELQLIKEVRRRPDAWKDGTDPVRKDIAWREIGNALQIGSGVCKTKFNSMRSNNGRSKRNVKNGAAKKRYKFDEQLKFLESDQNDSNFEMGSLNGNFSSSVPVDDTENRPTPTASVLVNFSTNSVPVVNSFRIVQTPVIETNDDLSDAGVDESEGAIRGSDTDDTELLIFYIQPRPHLWNFQSKSNRDRDMASNGWNSVTELMGKGTAKHWKTKWAGLVAKRRALREKYPSGSAAENAIDWPYFDVLDFLDDLRRYRQTESNFRFNEDEPSLNSVPATNADENSNDAAGITGNRAKGKTTGSESKSKPSGRQSVGSADGENSATTATSSLLAEYFKQKRMDTKPSSICAEARLVDATMQRLKPKTTIEFRLRLYALLAEIEAENSSE